MKDQKAFYRFSSFTVFSHNIGKKVVFVVVDVVDVLDVVDVVDVVDCESTIISFLFCFSYLFQ